MIIKSIIRTQIGLCEHFSFLIDFSHKKAFVLFIVLNCNAHHIDSPKLGSVKKGVGFQGNEMKAGLSRGLQSGWVSAHLLTFQ